MDDSKDNDITTVPIGVRVCRSFGPLGVFHGTVTKTRLLDRTRLYHIQYDDGDDEELDECVVLELLDENKPNRKNGANGTSSRDTSTASNISKKSKKGKGNKSLNDTNNDVSIVSNSVNNSIISNFKKSDRAENENQPENSLLNSSILNNISTLANTSSILSSSSSPTASTTEEKWYAYWNDQYDRHYYYNPKTNETTWTMPDNFVDEGDGDDNENENDENGDVDAIPRSPKAASQASGDTNANEPSAQPIEPDGTPQKKSVTFSSSTTTFTLPPSQRNSDSEPMNSKRRIVIYAVLVGVVLWYKMVFTVGYVSRFPWETIVETGESERVGGSVGGSVGGNVGGNVGGGLIVDDEGAVSDDDVVITVTAVEKVFETEVVEELSDVSNVIEIDDETNEVEIEKQSKVEIIDPPTPPEQTQTQTPELTTSSTTTTTSSTSTTTTTTTNNPLQPTTKTPILVRGGIIVKRMLQPFKAKFEDLIDRLKVIWVRLFLKLKERR